MYGLGGEWDALAALIEYGDGKYLTEADRAEMFRLGYMNDDYTPTPAAHKAREDRKTGDDMYVGGRVTAGADHRFPTMAGADSGQQTGDDSHLSEVVNLGHGAGVPQPRFAAHKTVPYNANDGDTPEQMQGEISRPIDWGMDTIAARKGRAPQAS
jgi:hypothetical protein